MKVPFPLGSVAQPANDLFVAVVREPHLQYVEASMPSATDPLGTGLEGEVVPLRNGTLCIYEGEGDEINPGRWGKRLAEYLSVRLRNKGIAVGNIYSEDWGWAIPIEGKPFNMWIGCGNYEEYPDGFLCFIEPSKPMIRKSFKKIDISKDIAFISETIDQILNADAEINNIRWWTNDGKTKTQVS